MKSYIKEIVIDLTGKNEGILARQSIIVRVGDEGGGPYIDIRGSDFDATEREDANSFSISTEKEIDELSAILKTILKDAQGDEE